VWYAPALQPKAMYSRILGTGSYLPARVLTNADLEKMVDTTDDWIRTRTGIERRHLAADEQTTCDLAEAAARRAMHAAGVGPSDIDFIALGTTTPDQIFPNTACLLQSRLKISGPPAIQIEAACTGFLYALSVADKFIRLGEAKCALVIGAECLSRLVDWTDRGTCVLFGDGAGAVILGPSEQAGILSTHLHANGEYADLLFYPTGPSRRHNASVAQQAAIHMKGAEVFKVAVNTLAAVVDETLLVHGLEKSSIDWLVPHQANLRLIEAVARKLRFPMERVIVTVREHGNTSAASVPIALDSAIRDGRLKAGQLLMLEAFGGGFTWGSALIRL
jgi:3-oxoacyl-[acyl-carrier-protein] synthase-3